MLKGREKFTTKIKSDSPLRPLRSSVDNAFFVSPLATTTPDGGVTFWSRLVESDFTAMPISCFCLKIYFIIL